MAHDKPFDLPVLGSPTADTHAHLDMLDDPAGALERAAVAGVMFVVTVADVTEAPLGTFDELPVWLSECERRFEEWDLPQVAPPSVRIIVGIHPHNAKGFTTDVQQTLLTLAKDPRVGGIGEIGLDFHYDHSPRDHQRRAFEAQLETARILDLPVAVHLREAHEEGLAILRNQGIPEAGCVIHCFTEGPKTAELFLELGCDISFAGPVTFAKADAIREAVAAVPLENLLAETDSPFMAPAPYRGRPNEPAWVTLTIEKIAEIKLTSPAEVAEAVMANARRVFGRDRG